MNVEAVISDIAHPSPSPCAKNVSLDLGKNSWPRQYFQSGNINGKEEEDLETLLDQENFQTVKLYVGNEEE